jgi:hypothetical protein
MTTNVDSSQAFVAMWFNEVTQAAYEKGMAPAIREAGYEPLRTDGKDHVNKIDDESSPRFVARASSWPISPASQRRCAAASTSRQASQWRSPSQSSGRARRAPAATCTPGALDLPRSLNALVIAALPVDLGIPSRPVAAVKLKNRTLSRSTRSSADLQAVARVSLGQMRS